MPNQTALIKTTLASSLMIVLCGFAPAYGQTAPPSGTVAIRSISYQGNGCPMGTVAPHISDDSRAFTLLFSSFTADSQSNSAHGGGSSTQMSDSKNCVINMSLDYPRGWSFSVIGVDVRGYARLDAGSTGTQTLIFRSGLLGLNRQFNTIRLSGPFDDDYLKSSQFNLPQPDWAPCGVFGIGHRLIVRSQISATSHPNAVALLTVDSIDGEVHQKYGLAWRTCTPPRIFR